MHKLPESSLMKLLAVPRSELPLRRSSEPITLYLREVIGSTGEQGRKSRVGENGTVQEELSVKTEKLCSYGMKFI